MVNNRIKVLRTIKGLTQKEMADQLHKSQSAYSRMESGELTITTDELQDIATILGCQPEDLLKEQGVINILHHNDNATGVHNESHNSDPKFVESFKEILTLVADQQQKANEELRQFVKEQQEQMASLMKALVAALKK